MPRPSDFSDIAALLNQLAERSFWGNFTVYFQDGGLVRCVLEESAKHPRQLMRNGNPVEAQNDNTR